MLQAKLKSAIEKLNDNRFDFIGADKREQKKEVLRAAIAVMRSNESDTAIGQFVLSLEENPDYAHTFKPGKESETQKLVREFVALYPAVQSHLTGRCERLEQAQNNRRSMTLFERLKRVNDSDQLNALRQLIVPSAQLPVTTSIAASASAEQPRQCQ